PSIQQKYCDQGRSIEPLTTTWPIFRARNSCGSGGKPRNASILPSAKSSLGAIVGLVTQLISFAGSSPTCVAMVDKNTWGDAPRSGTPTVLPLRSAIVRIRSVATSSKQPTCTPATIVIFVIGRRDHDRDDCRRLLCSDHR